MVKANSKRHFFLGQPSEPATKADIQIGKDLQDTLQANREQCVGMACQYDWCKEEYHYCEYGIHRCCDVQSGDCFKRDMYETEEGWFVSMVFVRRPGTRK